MRKCDVIGGENMMTHLVKVQKLRFFNLKGIYLNFYYAKMFIRLSVSDFFEVYPVLTPNSRGSPFLGFQPFGRFFQFCCTFS